MATIDATLTIALSPAFLETSGKPLDAPFLLRRILLLQYAQLAPQTYSLYSLEKT